MDNLWKPMTAHGPRLNIYDRSNENDNDVVPNLFERINSMKAEESSVIRPRLLSTNSQVC